MSMTNFRAEDMPGNSAPVKAEEKPAAKVEEKKPVAKKAPAKKPAAKVEEPKAEEEKKDDK